MKLIEEVLAFSREYVNKPLTRTPARKAKIREVIKNLTGQKLDISCGTCYLEALFKIINLSSMATSKYEIKRGALVQVFGHPDKAVTNNTITDEIGDWYVQNHPEKLVYFARYPGKGVITPAATPGIQIIPAAVKNEQIPEAKEVPAPEPVKTPVEEVKQPIPVVPKAPATPKAKHGSKGKT